jgi:hypothetical protein
LTAQNEELFLLLRLSFFFSSLLAQYNTTPSHVRRINKSASSGAQPAPRRHRQQRKGHDSRADAVVRRHHEERAAEALDWRQRVSV